MNVLKSLLPHASLGIHLNRPKTVYSHVLKGRGNRVFSYFVLNSFYQENSLEFPNLVGNSSCVAVFKRNSPLPVKGIFMIPTFPDLQHSQMVLFFN